MNEIRFLKRNEINERAWNECVEKSVYSLPYAYVWYLDAVAENFDALVLNNYEAVFPLVWLKKFGIKCLYQPYYCQQLGVFGKSKLPAQTLNEFLTAAEKKFPYIHINLHNGFEKLSGSKHLKEKKNLLLLLNKEYAWLSKSFNDNHRRNILKANKAGMIFIEWKNLEAFQNFYLQNVNRTKENFQPKHEKIFRKLAKEILQRKAGQIFAAQNNAGQIFAAVLLLTHPGRFIAVINTSSPAGKRNGASHFLFSEIIRQQANSSVVLDFEGSSIPGIARFYEGFSAQPEIFYNYQTSVIKKLSQRFR